MWRNRKLHKYELIARFIKTFIKANIQSRTGIEIKKKTKTLIEIFEISGVRRFESVGPPAAHPDLTITTSQGANVTHLEHRRREIVAKNARILAVLTDDGVGGATVEKHLVGMEETSLAHEVPEVTVVENKRCKWVQWS